MAFVSQTSLPSDDRVVLTNIKCDDAVQKGDWVRYNDSNILVPARADIITTSWVIGLVETVSTNFATVLIAGVSVEIFTDLDLQSQYFLSISDSGKMYAPPVSLMADSVILCLGRPATSTKFIVRIAQPLKRSS